VIFGVVATIAFYCRKNRRQNYNTHGGDGQLSPSRDLEFYRMSIRLIEQARREHPLEIEEEDEVVHDGSDPNQWDFVEMDEDARHLPEEMNEDEAMLHIRLVRAQRQTMSIIGRLRGLRNAIRVQIRRLVRIGRS